VTLPALSPAWRNAVLISPRQLARQIASGPAPVILAVRSADTDGPIPRAQLPRLPRAIDTDLALDFASPGGGRAGSRPLPDIDALQDKARDWGIFQDSEVVVYDHDGGLQAARAWWVLRWAGIGRVRLLDGGYAAWQAIGQPDTSAVYTPRRGNVKLSSGHMPQMTEDQAADMARDGVLLDTRIRPNYEGGPTTAGEAPRGHIPGARSLPAMDNLNTDMSFLESPALQRQFTELGVQAGHPVGVYCGAGVSAAHAILALACLGIEAPMYVGSWSAWSADPERPVAQGSAPG